MLKRAIRRSDKVRYLRHGAWCECECSCNTASGVLEAGVSVYECEDAGEGKWQGKGKAYDKNVKGFNYLNPRTKWYLVRGRVEGLGSDGEPLLKDVIPHRIVVWDKKKFFLEKDGVKSIEHNRHPRFPKCMCDIYDPETGLISG